MVAHDGASFRSRMRGTPVNFKRVLSVLVVVVAIVCGPLVAPAAANDQVSPSVATVEAELKVIFERYLHESPDGSWHVNVQAVRADGAPEAELRRIADGFNSVLGKAVFPEGL